MLVLPLFSSLISSTPTRRARVTLALAGLALAGGCIDTTAGPMSTETAEEGESAASSVAAPQPHVVVLMLDDVDARTFSRALSAGLLPSMKSHVVDMGVDFTASFSTDAICCPSRTTFFTGQYAHNHGVKDVSTGYNYVYPTDQTGQGGESTFLPVWLTSVGYHTALFGKYLNGYGSAANAAHVPPGWDHWLALQGSTTYQMYGYQYNENGALKTGGDDDVAAGDDPDYQTDFLAGKVVSYLDTVDPAAPQFLYLAPTAPHTEAPEVRQSLTYAGNFGWPIRPPHRYEALTDGNPANGEVPAQIQAPNYNEGSATYAKKPGWMQASVPSMSLKSRQDAAFQYKSRLAALKAVDDMIGTVAGKLAERGMLEDTLFIVTADNGYLLGEHRLAQKGVSYEEAIRVPLVVRPPGAAEGALGCARMAANTDLAATIADFAQVPATRTMDGRSLRPLIEDPLAPWSRRSALVEHFQESTGNVVFDSIWPHGTVRTAAPDADEQYTSFDVSQTGQITSEYYDLAVDPYQLDNTEGSLTPVKRSALKASLSALRSCKGSACAAAEDQ